jgi:tRNA dimethylallyltransferase
MKKVIVLVGPTESGKTGLSIKLAKRLNAEIINGDSVQVYQGLDIGAAKIKPSEQQGIKHHLLGIRDVLNPYSVYHFQQDARKLIEEIKVPLIVGGTGLYIKAVLDDYEFSRDHNQVDIEEECEELSNEELYLKLLKLDPEIAIDQFNRRRLIRAYELALSGDHRSRKVGKDERLYDALILYLDIDRNLLEERLIKRLDLQIKEGFIDEVNSFYNQEIHVNAIGYREIEQFLNQEISLDEAKNKIIKVTRKLAKKQKTWFKNQMNPIMLDALSDTLDEDALKLCIDFLSKEN